MLIHRQPSSSPPAPERFLPYARQGLEADDIAAAQAALSGDYVTQGPRVEALETALCEATGAAHAVAVSNGTAALHLACQVLDCGQQTPAAVPAITFAATANAVRLCGGQVAFAEIETASGLSTAASLVKALAEARARTADDAPGILLPVSLNGLPPDLPAIATAARRHAASVIEDAAHSLGATYPDGPDTHRSASCAHSALAILSFHAVKAVCAGEGGAVLTRDPALAGRLRRLRSHGIERPATNGTRTPAWYYDQLELGQNYRMAEVPAALALSQLGKLAHFLARRRHLAERYHHLLEGAPFNEHFSLPPLVRGHAWHLFALRFHEPSERDAAHLFLKEAGIGTQVHYRPVHQMTYYRELQGCPSLKRAEVYGAGCLSIPLFPGLSEAEQDWVVHTLRRFCLRPRP